MRSAELPGEAAITTIEKRLPRRGNIRWAVRIRGPICETGATIRNISEEGALLTVIPAPPVGTEISILSPDDEQRAVVTWSRSGRIGVRFCQVEPHIGAV